MDLNKIPLLAALTRRMEWLGERQRVLAENVANADTPGYRPHDLKPMGFRDLLKDTAGGVQLAATDPQHLVRGTSVAQASRPDRNTYESAPSGNAVVLEEQLMKVAETQLDYQTTTNLYRKHVGLLKLAIGRNNGM